MPSFGTRPKVGLRPVSPQNAAGIRMLPAVSVPTAPRNIPSATPDAEPELEPPAHLAESHGFRGTGKGLAGSGIPHANSIVVVLPMTTAPAARSRRATVAVRLAP